MSLKKIDIAKAISLKANVSTNVSKDILVSVLKIITNESDEFDVKIPSFGTFAYKVSPERIGRNPKTKEEYIISERVKLNFIVSNKVKEQLN
jgi:integration host factor subunit alpha